MTRLYIPLEITIGTIITLTPEQSHYLIKVLRLTAGSKINIFNQEAGEWSAEIIQPSNKASIRTLEQIKKPHVCNPLWLCFSPLKNDAMTYLVEKATELGVTHLQPILTERCNNSRLNSERLQKNAIEASQQCERFDVPEVLPLQSLEKFLTHWNSETPIIACIERSETQTIYECLKKEQSLNVAFLIGPEGGFSDAEQTLMQRYPFIKTVTLGPRILRAETASAAVLACYQAIKGDWKN